MKHYKHVMNSYRPKSPDRSNGRYAGWLEDNYDTNYWRFINIWRPKNKFDLWWITHGSYEYEKQDDRATVKRWEPWEGMSSDLMMFTYPEEIKKAYNKKKKKEIKSVYKPFRG
jgi:hypothetical protein